MISQEIAENHRLKKNVATKGVYKKRTVQLVYYDLLTNVAFL